MRSSKKSSSYQSVCLRRCFTCVTEVFRARRTFCVLFPRNARPTPPFPLIAPPRPSNFPIVTPNCWTYYSRHVAFFVSRWRVLRHRSWPKILHSTSSSTTPEACLPRGWKPLKATKLSWSESRGNSDKQRNNDGACLVIVVVVEGAFVFAHATNGLFTNSCRSPLLR